MLGSLPEFFNIKEKQSNVEDNHNTPKDLPND